MTAVTILAGGVGGARFAAGVRELARTEDLDITIVVNTGDDLWLAGLRVCPDLDSVMYALGGVSDTSRGWGRSEETERVSAELSAYGVGWPWFTLGDLDLGTHIARTAMLKDGLSITEVTQRLSARWDLGVRLLPATDDEVETHVEIIRNNRTELIHFEEWWVRYRAEMPANRFVHRAIEHAAASPAAMGAVESADIVLVAPSNPVVSISTILSLPGMRDALNRTSAPVIGVSPIIAGSPVRGMADVCLSVVGIESSAAAVGLSYGSRDTGGILDGWLVDRADIDALPDLAAAGIASRAIPLWMTDPGATAVMVQAALELAASVNVR
ncbi:2-phospho-L-lactate transferase [Glaciihabitans sp. UYNi722]|uniref:2-phospho-L-lactate transferase n=1 Tax=Glaciihabitans sp. UYNi722 TaxID=3156344 RepID=UPI00339956B8